MLYSPFKIDDPLRCFSENIVFSPRLSYNGSRYWDFCKSALSDTS